MQVGDGKMFDLTPWTSTELRDVINTTCDMEILQSCQKEFHKRLKVRIQFYDYILKTITIQCY